MTYRTHLHTSTNFNPGADDFREGPTEEELADDEAHLERHGRTVERARTREDLRRRLALSAR
jgi:hypothetical protein